MKVTVTEFIEGKDGEEGYFIDHIEEREYPKSEGRHSDLCVVCGFPSYPKCREWCPHRGYNSKLK